MSVARFGFFVCFIGLVAVGYYAYMLRKDLVSANDSVNTQTAQVASWKMKFDESEKTSKANADATLSCQQNAKQLEAQLAAAQAANAAVSRSSASSKSKLKR